MSYRIASNFLYSALVLCAACGGAADNRDAGDGQSTLDLPSVRLPATGFRSVALSDGGELMFALHLRFAGGDVSFFEMRGEEVLDVAAEELNGRTCDALQEASSDDGDIEYEIEQDIKRFYDAEHQSNPNPGGASFVTFEFVVGACREP